MFEKFGFSKDVNPAWKSDVDAVRNHNKTFKHGKETILEFGAFYKKDRLIGAKIVLRRGTFFAEANNTNRKFIESLIKKSNAGLQQLPLWHKKSSQINASQKKMASKTRYILAHLDHAYGIHDAHLNELIKRKVIHPVTSRKALAAIATKVALGAKLEDLYLIPAHLMPKDNETDGINIQHQRVIQTGDGIYSLKGSGARHPTLSPRLLSSPNDLSTYYEVPYGLMREARYVIGGLVTGEATDTYNIFEKLRTGYERFLKSEPQVARQLGVDREIPFSIPVAVFEPLLLLGRKTQFINGKLLDQKPARIRASELRKSATGGSSHFKNLSVLITKNQGGNFRLLQLMQHAHYDFTEQQHLANVRMAHRDWLQTFKNLDAPPKDRFAYLHDLSQNTALAAIYISRKYAGLACHGPSNSWLSPKDFTFGGFADTNNVVEATNENKNADITSLKLIDKTLKTFHPTGTPIEQHPLYEHVIRGI